MQRRNIMPWLFLLPALVVYTVFRIVPFLGTIVLSFTQYNGLTPPVFVGLGNYLHMVREPVFWLALRNNVIWFFGEVLVSTFISLFLAVLLNQNIRMRTLFRTTLFLPVVLSWAVVGMLWNRIYNPVPTFGLINGLFRALGHPEWMHNWLGDPNLALPSIIVAAIWKGFGFSMVIFLAGLQNIPRELEEAAELDGATHWQVFWRITFPLLRPVTSIVLVLGLIGTFRVFDPVWVMTQGGPGSASSVIAVLVYQVGLSNFDLGYGSALSMALLACAMAAMLTYFRIFGRGEAH